MSQKVKPKPKRKPSRVRPESRPKRKSQPEPQSQSFTPRSRLEVEDYGRYVIVNFLDRKILDERAIQRIGEDLFALVDLYDHKQILLNFSNVEYLSSAALGKFISLNKKVQGKSGELVLSNINEDIYEVFELTRLDRLFKIEKDEQSGVDVFTVERPRRPPKRPRKTPTKVKPRRGRK